MNIFIKKKTYDDVCLIRLFIQSFIYLFNYQQINQT